MCRIAIDLEPPAVTIPEPVISRRGFASLAIAALIGAALGLAEARASVTWPPVAALVVCCAGLAVATPRAAWALGLVAGLAAAAADLTMGQGRDTLMHVGVLGAFAAPLPALAGAHVGQLVALAARRVRTREAQT